VKWIFALGLMLMLPGPASAQAVGADCVALPTDAERLACFEQLYAQSESPATIEPLVVQSEHPIPAAPSGRENATMTIACETDLLTVRFRFAGQVLTPNGSRTGIGLQRDLRADQIVSLPPSSDGEELLITGPDAGTFLRSLQGVTMLTVRVTPFSYRPLLVRFRVADLQAQFTPLIDTCG
jgi:type VI secretion system protein VasI